MSYCTLYRLDGTIITDGVQSSTVCDEAINMARRIAAKDCISVIVEDRGSEKCYRVTPTGRIWRTPSHWPAPSWQDQNC